MRVSGEGEGEGEGEGVGEGVGAHAPEVIEVRRWEDPTAKEQVALAPSRYHV